MTITRDTLLKMLTLSEKKVYEMFMNIEGYQYIAGKRGNYLLMLPTTSKITPVLLCAHVDTLTTGLIDIEIDKNGEVYNRNGVLGADDRAGCAILHSIANNFTNKPVILLTSGEETGFTGMHSFVQSRNFTLINDCVYTIISVDVSDDMKARYYNNVISDALSDTLIDLGYNVEVGKIPSDGYLLASVYEKAYINVSHGGKDNHLTTECISLDLFKKNENAVLSLVNSISKEHAEVYNALETSPKELEFVDDICEICNNLSRQAKYSKELEVNICFSCKNRVINSKTQSIGNELIKEQQLNLRRAQIQSYMSNLNKLAGALKGSSQVEACPVCGGDKVVYNKTRGCSICVDCKGKYLLDSLVNNAAHSLNSFNGDIILRTDPLYDGKIISIVIDNDVHIISQKTKEVLDKYFLVHKDRDFIVCHKCNGIHPKNYSAKRQMLVSTDPVQKVKLNVCKGCLTLM